MPNMLQFGAIVSCIAISNPSILSPFTPLSSIPSPSCWPSLLPFPRRWTRKVQQTYTIFMHMSFIIWYWVDRSLQYNDLSNRVIGLTKDDVPADLKKKVTLLIYFSQYMDEHLIYGADVDASKRQSTFNCGPSLVSAGGVFMKKWFRTDRAIVMHLSNGTLQVCHCSVGLQVKCFCC